MWQELNFISFCQSVRRLSVKKKGISLKLPPEGAIAMLQQSSSRKEMSHSEDIGL